jgi:transglutaminase-like putative cysteine protease
LYEWVRDRVTFRRDPVEQERVQDTLRTAKLFRTGDCDDKTVCLAGLLGALGHRSRFVVIGTPQQFSHVFLEVQTRGGWVALDPTPERYQAGQRVSGAPSEARYEIYGTGAHNEQILAAAVAVGIAIYFFSRKG